MGHNTEDNTFECYLCTARTTEALCEHSGNLRDTNTTKAIVTNEGTLAVLLLTLAIFEPRLRDTSSASDATHKSIHLCGVGKPSGLMRGESQPGGSSP